MHPLAKLLPFSALCLGLGLGIAWFSARPEATSAHDDEALPAFDPSMPGRAPAAFGSSSDFGAAPAALVRGTVPDSTEPAAGATFAAGAGSASPAAAELAPETRDRLIAEIEAAYTTYHPDALPVLARFLAHADPEIRTFAREAIMQVGHADGIAYLRKAAQEAHDPRESAALLDAAEFLEIPPAPPLPGTFKVRGGPRGRDVTLRTAGTAAP